MSKNAAELFFSRLMDATVLPGYSKREAIAFVAEELTRTRVVALDCVRDAVGFAADVPEQMLLDSLRNLVARIRSFEAAQQTERVDRAALASQSESHAAELARLKEEHRGELGKAWDEGYISGRADYPRLTAHCCGIWPRCNHASNGELPIQNPYSQQSRSRARRAQMESDVAIEAAWHEQNEKNPRELTTPHRAFVCGYRAAYERGFQDGKRSVLSFDEETDVS